MRYATACDYPIPSTSAPTSPASRLLAAAAVPSACATSSRARKPRASRPTDVSSLALAPAGPRPDRQTSAMLDRAPSSCTGSPPCRGGPSNGRRRGGTDIGAVDAAAATATMSETDPPAAAASPRRPIPLPHRHRADPHDPQETDASEPRPDDGDDDERRAGERLVRGGDLGSSEESLSPDSLAPSSLSTIRSRLFASDDEQDEDREDLDGDGDGDGESGSALSSWSAGLSPSSCFSSFAPPPPRRSRLSSTAATSDPLRHSFTPPPKLEFDHARRRRHWVPAPALPTAETVSSAPPDVPDVVRSSLAASASTSGRTPPSSPPRASPCGSPPPSSSTKPESLLTKSLRSLSRLPNLTLADVLPRAASSSSMAPTAEDEDLAALPPGWGPAERRRVLAEEPSHAADEARAGFRYLLRRPPSPFSLAGRRLSSSSSSSSSPSVMSAAAVSTTLRKSSAVDWSGHAIDEVEALGYGFGFGLQDLGRDRGRGGSGLAGEHDREPSLSSSALEEDAPSCADAPTSTSADVPPLPPRPRDGKRQRIFVDSSPGSAHVLAAGTTGASSPVDEAALTAAAAAAAPPSLPVPGPQPLPPRFVSNHRHLLMLSLEFEMMRHAKIRGPLRQRAVIVRPATSPPREQGASRERSRLCHELEA